MTYGGETSHGEEEEEEEEEAGRITYIVSDDGDGTFAAYTKVGRIKKL